MSVFTPEAWPSRTSGISVLGVLKAPMRSPRPSCATGPMWALGGIQPLTEAAVTVGPRSLSSSALQMVPKRLQGSRCLHSCPQGSMDGWALPCPPPGTLLGDRAPAQRVLDLHSPSTKDWPRLPTSRPAFGQPLSCKPCSMHQATWAGSTQTSLASPWARQGLDRTRCHVPTDSTELALAALPSVSPMWESRLQPVGAQAPRPGKQPIPTAKSGDF